MEDAMDRILKVLEIIGEAVLMAFMLCVVVRMIGGVFNVW